MEILRVEQLSFLYPGAAKKALREVSFSLEEGGFYVVCGPSGCGKTTLLRLLKKELSPAGEYSGQILYCGKQPEELSGTESAGEIGFVQQNPESQVVMDKVWHELAFGLENMGIPKEEMKRRIGEMCSFFGIASWYHRETATLSGGQKQLLSLAAVVAMRPKLLILDEPTAQLDPVAASNFIGMLRKINQELGITILLSEHHLEEVLAEADRALVMEQGRIVLNCPVRQLWKLKGSMTQAMPCAVQLYQAFPHGTQCPVTVKEGRNYLKTYFKGGKETAKPFLKKRNPLFKLTGIWYRYERHLPDVLKQLDLTVEENEILAVLGGNGAGKSTVLRLLSGQVLPLRGKVVLQGKNLRRAEKKVALLPQNPQEVFLKETLGEDLRHAAKKFNVPQRKVEEMAAFFELAPLLKQHPYDLSGGEQQRAALAKLLLCEPEVLLMDEPVKGMDVPAQHKFGTLLRKLQRSGATIVLVTHDIEFAALYADRAAMLFDGQLTRPQTPQEFFSQNYFYTTAASRIGKELYPEAVTVRGLLEKCREEAGKNE